MTSPESIALIGRAREGDRAVWHDISKRYYPNWVRQLHGKLGADLRSVCGTADPVQSALAYAFKRIKDPKNDGAFFAWVAAIGIRKIYAQRRRAGSSRKVPLDAIADLPELKSPVGTRLGKGEEGERVLDAILRLFPHYGDPMGAVYLKYYHKQPIAQLAAIQGKSEQTIARFLTQALELLEKELKRRGGRGERQVRES